MIKEDRKFCVWACTIHRGSQKWACVSEDGGWIHKHINHYTLQFKKKEKKENEGFFQFNFVQKIVGISIFPN